MTHIAGYPLSKSLLLDLTKIRAPFNDVPVENAYTGKKLEHEWQLHLISEDSPAGYDGALFSTEINGQPHYFIYHQGANDVRDIPSAARLANHRIPQQAQDAARFSEQAMRFIAERHPGQRVPVVQAGYSIGGALAMLVSHDDHPVIAFDSPGMRKILEKAGRNPDAIGQRTLEILSPHPNLANAHGEHIGGIIEAGEKYWETGKLSSADFLRMAAQTHHIRNIGLGLASVEDFTPVPPRQAGRPSEMFDAFRAYIQDNMGQNPSLGERALSFFSKVADALWLDKLGTKIAAFCADHIAGKFSTEVVEQGTQQAYPRPVTHPDVRHQVAEHQPAPEIQAPYAAPPAKSYTQDILAERQQQAAATAMGGRPL